MKSTIHIDAEQAAKEDQLVREHLPLVQYVVSEVAHRVPNHVSRNDLVSAGMLVMLGGVWSSTVIVWVMLLLLPQTSVA